MATSWPRTRLEAVANSIRKSDGRVGLPRLSRPGSSWLVLCSAMPTLRRYIAPRLGELAARNGGASLGWLADAEFEESIQLPSDGLILTYLSMPRCPFAVIIVRSILSFTFYYTVPLPFTRRRARPFSCVPDPIDVIYPSIERAVDSGESLRRTLRPKVYRRP